MTRQRPWSHQTKRCAVVRGATLAATLFALAGRAALGTDCIVDDETTSQNGGHPEPQAGDTLTITEDGSITREGGRSECGAFGTAGNITVTDRGRIRATGDNARGIFLRGGHDGVTNWGHICIAKKPDPTAAAPAVAMWDGNNTAINHATIHGEGTAVSVMGGNNTAINHGMINTFGFWSEAICARGNNDFVANHGDAIAVGEGSASIRSIGGHSAPTNAGRVMSLVARSIWFASGQGEVLNLLSPSHLAGNVALAGGAVVNVQTGSHSARWKFGGTMDGGAPNTSGPVTGFCNPAMKNCATFEPTMLVDVVDQLGRT